MSGNDVVNRVNVLGIDVDVPKFMTDDLSSRVRSTIREVKHGDVDLDKLEEITDDLNEIEWEYVDYVDDSTYGHGELSELADEFEREARRVNDHSVRDNYSCISVSDDLWEDKLRDILDDVYFVEGDGRLFDDGEKMVCGDARELIHASSKLRKFNSKLSSDIRRLRKLIGNLEDINPKNNMW